MWRLPVLRLAMRRAPVRLAPWEMLQELPEVDPGGIVLGTWPPSLDGCLGASSKHAVINHADAGDCRSPCRPHCLDDGMNFRARRRLIHALHRTAADAIASSHTVASYPLFKFGANRAAVRCTQQW